MPNDSEWRYSRAIYSQFSLWCGRFCCTQSSYHQRWDWCTSQFTHGHQRGTKPKAREMRFCNPSQSA